jgi:hypothetical protein
VRPSLIRGIAAAAVLAVALAVPATAPAASPEPKANLQELTSNGFVITVRVRKSGKKGSLEVACPGGKGLGVSASFTFKKGGKFKAGKRKKHKRLFSFKGRFDTTDHFTGAGSVRSGSCGKGAPTSFSEGTIGQPRMTSCPQTTVATPFPSNTPFTFTGVLPNAAKGTELRIEYINPNSPNGQPDVAHVVTDVNGNFSDTHVHPSAGFIYGGGATPRYPDDPLGTGQPCSYEVL